MRADEYARYDGLGLAELVRHKDVTAREVATAATSAMRAINAKLNFIAGEIPDFANASLASLTSGTPFQGVPSLIKDVGPRIAGVPQEMGCAMARGLVPTENSELATRFLRAGLVFIGRSTTPELGMAFTTEPRTIGPTRNPWDTTRSPGGSSGGAAVAVATGVVPIAQGGDTGGSIRIPAHCTGVFGLKPTRGRNPTGPEIAEGSSGMTVAHVITRSVRDSAAMLDATCGPDAGPRYFAPPPRRPFLDEVTRPRQSIRVAFSTTNPFGGRVDPEVRKATEDAAHLCETLGHTVEAADMPCDADDFREMLTVLSAGNLYYGIRGLEARTGLKASNELLESFTMALYRQGQTLLAGDFVAALSRMNQYSRQVGQFFTRYDVILTPVFTAPALNLGEMSMDQPISDINIYIEEILRVAGFTMQYNFTGQPAMSVPLYQSASGLPIGVQFAARYAEEDVLFSLAGQLEQALPWRDRHPPIGIFA